MIITERDNERREEKRESENSPIARQEPQKYLPLGVVINSVSGGDGSEDDDHHFSWFLRGTIQFYLEPEKILYWFIQFWHSATS